MSLFSILRGSRNDETRGAWNDTGSGAWFSPSGDSGYVNEVTALNLSAVWACETLITDLVAAMPDDTYRKSGGTRVPTTPPDWFEHPNPENTHIDYETQRVLSLLGWGNAYSLLVRKSGYHSDPNAPILERWVIDPWKVDVRREGGLPSYYVEGAPVAPAAIQHVKGYTLPGRCTGMSVITAANRSLQLANSGENTATRLMDSGINASGVLSIPSLPEETNNKVVDRLREQFQERYAGSANTGKPIALTGGTTWNQTSINPVDAQFLETRKFQIEEIARWFRVPLHEIQHIADHASQGGGNGIEAQSLNLLRRTLLPWTLRLEQADSDLLVRGQYVKKNANSFLRADITTRYEAYAKAREWGWMSVNDILQYEDELPIDNGDIYLQPMNFTEAGTDPVDPPAPPVPPGTPEGVVA